MEQPVDMDSSYVSRAETIMKGILASQILSVPFSSSLSLVAVILAWRFLSKTSNKYSPHEKYFEFQAGISSPARRLLARLGAGMVAIVCLAMTAMELTIVYQTAIIYPNDMRFLIKTPWTSSLVPLLTSLVSIATQTYFSEKVLNTVERPRLVTPFLILLSLGSVVTGGAATIALILEPSQRSSAGISTSETLFWTYLLFATLSSGFLMIPLLLSFNKKRNQIKKEGHKKPNNQKHDSTWVTFTLRVFLSTYAFVFIFDLLCLITSVISASTNFELALQASQGFLVLQKLMVRIMAISYLYALLDDLPKNLVFVPPPEVPILVGFGNGFEPKVKSPVQEYNSEAFPRSRLRDIRSSVNLALNKYENSKNRQLSSEDEGDDLFPYSYPPNVVSPAITEIFTSMNFTIQENNWEKVGYSPAKLVPIPEKTRLDVPFARRKSSTPSVVKPFALPPVPSPIHTATAAFPNYKEETREDKMPKHRLSDLRLINTPLSKELMAETEWMEYHKA
ncbi:hypothetical protein O181_084393 [Austropuccinia psidii MF-1]|uniref:Uncharacterized protein n=1 Tax=Austropuccinia psidii MF-1 TaxID=1389203 RepID=A0A9Q3FVJ9_9BASI|nr:hypothetical protein [Austropuccinia psidii MF-1]